MKIGIVGSGMIVNDCLEALQGLNQISTSALCVREQSEEKGKRLCEQFAINCFYIDYDQFLAEAEMDAVYIGIVNSEHYTYAKKALEAGRHVILEKPFTAYLWQAAELAALARQKKLFLFEAITTLYFPNLEWMKENLQRIGEIKVGQCNFSQYSSRYDNYMKGTAAPAFDPACAGGALYDINIYNIHFAAALLGEPEEVSYFPNIGYNGIDTSGVLILSYPGFRMECVGAKDSSSPHFALLQGTKGYMKMTGQTSICPSVELCIGNQTVTAENNCYSHRMQHELAAFADYFERQDYEACYDKLEHTLSVMNILETARQGAGIEFV